MSLLRLDAISLSFGGLTAVDGVSFAVERGEIGEFRFPYRHAEFVTVLETAGDQREFVGGGRLDGVVVGRSGGIRPVPIDRTPHDT